MMTYLSGGGFSIFDLRFSIGSSDWSPPQQIENQQDVTSQARRKTGCFA